MILAQANRMPRRAFEETATISIKDERGREMTASAVLLRDPRFLHWNRIRLIGSEDQMLEAMRLNEETLTWELLCRPDWPLNNDPSYRFARAGTGVFRSIGISSGATIASDSIQPFADIDIFDSVETVASADVAGLSAEYWFLQRPSDWHVRTRNFRDRQSTRVAGSWQRVSQSGLKFRLLSIAHHRDDERLSQEIERIQIPAIEIEPLNAGMGADQFREAASELWFALRVLITFRFRQFVSTVAEFSSEPGKHTSKWYPVELQPRQAIKGHVDPPFYAPTERFLARGASALLKVPAHQELLHAAAFGYANSFNALMMEGALTSCVEAIERILEAFEDTRGLSRNLIDQKRWKSLGKKLRREASALTDQREEREAMNRAFSQVPRLLLIERIERMAAAFGRGWNHSSKTLLRGAERMIKARNDIVHGRVVEDLNIVYVELHRARALFERLFLSFLGFSKVQTSGYANLLIAHHDGLEESRKGVDRNQSE